MLTQLIFFSSLFVGLASLLTLALITVVASPQEITLVEFELWALGHTNLTFSVLFDLFSLVFLACVSLITCSVMLFSVSYMKTSRFSSAFHLLVVSFVGSMLMLILSPNLVTLMVGWDGLGISSFFLVIFYKSNKAFNAGLLTAISNRVGDSLILVSLPLGLFCSSFSLKLMEGVSTSLSPVLMFALTLAAFTKSAQIPFSAWLPAAMAAPTPVSALVHSSTLVTAGVYLLLRSLSTIWSELTGTVLGVLGGLTMTMASLSAFVESDLKKIVALSTLSQLGVMVLSLSLGNASMAFFHLIVHAFFKALLFIATGNLIHSSGDYQDLRRMGGHLPALPVTQATVIMTKLSLCGLPFFSAFFSKELVLESLSAGGGGELLIYLFMWAGVLATALYSLRFIYYILLSSRSAPHLWKSDYDLFIIGAMLVLYIPSFATGKFLLFSLMDFFDLPLVSPLAKFAVVSLLIVGGPLLLSCLTFIPSTSHTKSVFYLWFLSSWSGALMMSSVKTHPYSWGWSGSFGWKDQILGAWALPLAAAYSWSSLKSPKPFFKLLAGVALALLVWSQI